MQTFSARNLIRKPILSVINSVLVCQPDVALLRLLETQSRQRKSSLARREDFRDDVTWALAQWQYIGTTS